MYYLKNITSISRGDTYIAGARPPGAAVGNVCFRQRLESFAPCASAYSYYATGMHKTQALLQ